MEKNSTNFLPQNMAVSEGLESEVKITDFQQLANLGTGGYGKVNLYRHKSTGAEYAIKLIDKTKFENKLQKELFAREVDMMYKIRHPNIVRLYSHFEDESNCYIALEYIKKGNLYSYTQSMPNKVLDAATTAHFVVDLVSSLYYLHHMNPPIIHRDIKPENLLIGNNGQLKLTDFGGSNYLDTNVRFTTCGTQLYHSPEMLLKKGYDTRVDIWAIGILIFELMVGRPPFRSDPQHTMEDNITHLRINWPKSMNLNAKNLITQILKIDPDQRPTLEEILSHQFITTYVKDASSRLILPSDVEIKPFAISKQIPGQESLKTDEGGATNQDSFRHSENERYKTLYENLKITYEKLKKEKEELSVKKKEGDNKIEQLKKYMEDCNKMFQQELEKKMDQLLKNKKTISLNNEEIKRLKSQINLLEQKNLKLEKDLIQSEVNHKLKLQKYNEYFSQNQKINNQIIEGTLSVKNNLDTGLFEYSEDNLLSIYKTENENLKQEKTKLLQIIDDLNDKLSGKQKEKKLKEEKEEHKLEKLLKETEIELEMKNYLINKYTKYLLAISNYMEKIKFENYSFTYGGSRFANLENMKKMLSSAQSSSKSNPRSSSNSKDEYSIRRRTNMLSRPGSVIYFN